MVYDYVGSWCNYCISSNQLFFVALMGGVISRRFMCFFLNTENDNETLEAFVRKKSEPTTTSDVQPFNPIFRLRWNLFKTEKPAAKTAGKQQQQKGADKIHGRSN